MKKTLVLFVMLLSISAFSQRGRSRGMDQFSLEAGYGGNMAISPRMTDFKHFDLAFRYMIDEYWGMKFDYGSDQFRVDGNTSKGTDYHRLSAQVVHNLGRTLNISPYSDNWFNLTAHGGLGYSAIKSKSYSDVDSMGNIILGLTPQIKITDNLALRFDGSYIINISQDYNFNGTLHDPVNGEHFMGSLFNASVGLTLYLGRNGSDADFR